MWDLFELKNLFRYLHSVIRQSLFTIELLQSIETKVLFIFQVNYSEMEESLKSLRVHDVTLNFDEKVDDGTSASIFRHKLGRKSVAARVFKTNNITVKKMFTICFNLRKLNYSHIVEFIGYSIRPSILFFEYCCFKYDTDVYNLSTLLAMFN